MQPAKCKITLPAWPMVTVQA